MNWWVLVIFINSQTFHLVGITYNVNINKRILFVVGAGSEEVQLYLDRSPTSYNDCASCPQQRWLLPSWSLLSMSLVSRIGVSRSRMTKGGSIQIGTLNGSTVYHILLSSNLLPFLSK